MDKNHLVEEEGEGKSLNFIEQIIEEELAEEMCIRDSS